MNFEILFSEDCFKSEEIERVDTTPMWVSLNCSNRVENR
jgi:hypothetical protein